MGNIQFVIEDMQLCDTFEVSQIESECFTLAWSKKAFEEELENPQAIIIIAKDNNKKVLGFCNARVIFDECSINNVAVTEGARCNGIASAMLRELILRVEKNSEFITLEVRKSNEAAISLYRKLGFLQVGLRKNFYSQPTEDALLLTKYLKD